MLSASSQLWACVCLPQNFESRYQSSDFIATAKIISVSSLEDNSKFHKVEIQIIELYKGKHITSLSEASIQKTNCGIYTPANTTWLIYASYDDSGILNFNLCSESMQIDDIPYDPNYPSYKKNVESQIQHTRDILGYLKKKRLSELNKHRLVINMTAPCIQDLHEYDAVYSFAIYELSVSKNLAITKIKNLKTFNNKSLTKKLLRCIKKAATINTGKRKEIPSETKVIVIYFYYPREKNNPGFVSKHIY